MNSTEEVLGWAVDAVRSQIEATTAEAEAIAQAVLTAVAPTIWKEGRDHGAKYPFGKRGLGLDDNPYEVKWDA